MQRQNHKKRKEAGGKEKMRLFETEKKVVKRYKLTYAAKKTMFGLILVCLGACATYMFKEDCTAGIVLVSMGLCVAFAKDIK